MSQDPKHLLRLDLPNSKHGMRRSVTIVRVRSQRQVMLVFSTYDDSQQERTAVMLTDEQAIKIREFLMDVDGFSDGEPTTDIRNLLRGKPGRA